MGLPRNLGARHSEVVPWRIRWKSVVPIAWAARQVVVAPKYQPNWGRPLRPIEGVQHWQCPMCHHRQPQRRHDIHWLLGLCYGLIWASALLLWWHGDNVRKYDLDRIQLLHPQMGDGHQSHDPNAPITRGHLPSQTTCPVAVTDALTTRYQIQ